MTTRTTRWAALLSVIGALVTRFALDTTVGRNAPLQTFAEYSQIMTLGVLIATMAPLGLPESGNSFLPKYLATNNHGALKAYLISSTTLAVTMPVVLSAAAYPILTISSSRPFEMLASVAIVSTSLALLLTRRAHCLQLSGGNTALLSPALSTGLSVIIFGAALIAHMPVRPLSVAIAVAAGNFSVGILACRIGVPLLNRAPTAFADVRQWIAHGLQVVSNNLGSILLTQGDIILAAAIATPVQAGAYAAASRLALVVTLALGGLGPREAPILGRFVASGDFNGAWKHYQQAQLLTGVAGMTICLPLIVTSSFVLELFVPGSGIASTWLAILALGRVVSALVGPAAELLIALGVPRLAARATWWGVATTGVSLLPLTATLSTLGIALATSLGMITRSSLHYRYARRKCRLSATD